MRALLVISFFLLCTFPLVCTTVLSKETPFVFEELSIVWTADYENGEQVYFSSYGKKVWSIPVQISDSKSYVFQVTGTLTEDGRIWLIWTQADKSGMFLYSSSFIKDRWSRPVKITTGMADNRDSVINVDSSGTPFVAWTGVDKTYSDVFWSRWTGTSWSTALKAHLDNKVPDVSPSLIVNGSGEIELSWQTFLDGNSIAVSLQWNGTQWVESSPEFKKRNAALQKRRSENLPSLPGFIQERYKAYFLYRDNYGAGSIPAI